MNDEYYDANDISEKIALAKRRKLLVLVGCLYLTQGLPVGLAFEAFPVLLRKAGASLDLIALVPMSALPWVLKFLWAPIVENNWHSDTGRRRSWILPMQFFMAIILLAMAMLPFSHQNTVLLLALMTLGSLVGATQDIATDGLAIENLRDHGVGQASTLQVAGFMTGMLLGGPGAIISIGFVGHTVTLTVLAMIILLSSVPVLLWREPPTKYRDPPRAYIRMFFRQPFAVRILVMGAVLSSSGAILFLQIKLSLVDGGWSLTDVGFLTGIGQTIMAIAGSIIAVFLLSRFNRWFALTIGLVLVLISGLAWFGLSTRSVLPANLVWPAVIIGGLGGGIVGVGSYALFMRFSQLGEQPGTDFSIFQSSSLFMQILASSLATVVAARGGYSMGILLAVFLSLLSIVLTVWVRASTSELSLGDNRERDVKIQPKILKTGVA